MKQETIDQLTAADIALAKAAFMLTGPYIDEAGRHAYYAMFHAANAFVVERGFKPPKTHRGLHQLFARATQTEPALVPLVAQLGDSYSFKWDADYGPASSTITTAEAQHAIADAHSLHRHHPHGAGVTGDAVSHKWRLEVRPAQRSLAE